MIKKKLILFFIVFLNLISSFCNAEGDVKLLINGKQAFPEIINQIEKSEKSIYINMFIWRDDEIGNSIASKLLEAADRGVKIYISKDIYGSVCEHAEESGTSFFHKKVTLTEKIKIDTLKNMYHPEIIKENKDFESDLYKAFINHENISVNASEFKADHSKYYIFDDETLVLGGINIEDKENGQDLSGRIYQDYMILLRGRKYIDLFYSIKEFGIESIDVNSENIYFGMNFKSKESGKTRFEMEQLYLDIIDSSKEYLIIVMAYFTPRKNFIGSISEADKRGVKVKVVLPNKANFQDDSNKATAVKLLRNSKNNIDVYFSDKMLHTKLVMNEDVVSFGSCNITKKAFKQLDELNVFIKSSDSEIYKQILKSVEKTYNESKLYKDYKLIKYNHFKAWLESLLV